MQSNQWFRARAAQNQPKIQMNVLPTSTPE